MKQWPSGPGGHWPLDVTECAEFVSVCHSRDDLVTGGEWMEAAALHWRF